MSRATLYYSSETLHILGIGLRIGTDRSAFPLNFASWQLLAQLLHASFPDLSSQEQHSFQFGKRLQVFQTAVGDRGPVQHQFLQVRQLVEFLEGVVGDFRIDQDQTAKFGKLLQAWDAISGDWVAVKIEVEEFGEIANFGDAVVGHRASEQ